MRAPTLTPHVLPTQSMIGIVGGAGPYAAAYMHQQVIAAMQRRGAAEDHQFPGVIVCNVASRSTTVHGFAAENELEACEHVTRVARSLDDAGAVVLLPACNTFDAFRSKVQAGLNATVLSLPGLAAARAAGKGYRHIAVLCSDRARVLGLHRAALAGQGVGTIDATDATQREINHLIADVMDRGATREGRSTLEELCRRCRQDADAVLIGCTELSVFGLADENLIDSAQEGVSAAVDYAFQPRERIRDAGVQRPDRH
jgi:aspartate racemase